jgi:hypothetical protein
MGDTGPDVDEVAERNPAVDVDKLREAQQLIEELRERGVIGPSYDIASPYERRPVRSTESPPRRR